MVFIGPKLTNRAKKIRVCRGFDENPSFSKAISSKVKLQVQPIVPSKIVIFGHETSFFSTFSMGLDGFRRNLARGIQICNQNWKIRSGNGRKMP